MIVSLFKIYSHIEMYNKNNLRDLAKQFHLIFIRVTCEKYKNIKLFKNNKIIDYWSIF